MRIVNGLHSESIKLRPRVVAVGAFDGVHRGHQSLLTYLCRRAYEEGAESAIFTFEPIPAEVFRHSGHGGLRLTLRDERNALFERQCADLAIIADFDETFRNMSARDFARDVLVGVLGTKVLVASERHTFGRHAEADVRRIAELGSELGFRVEVLGTVALLGGVPIASTRVRRVLWEGDVAKAATLLGRPYSLCGTVVRGRGVGRTLGFPTANIAIPPAKLLPADGVYVAFAYADDLPPTPAAVNIGPAPTFGVAERLVEAHLIGADVDLVDRNVCLGFVERLRDAVKFEGKEALKAQIGADIATASEICSRYGAFDAFECPNCGLT